MTEPRDELIRDYAVTLRHIYSERSAGDKTFEGLLGEFAWHLRGTTERERDEARTEAEYERVERERVERELEGARRVWNLAHQQAITERDEAWEALHRVEAMIGGSVWAQYPNASNPWRDLVIDLRAALSGPVRSGAGSLNNPNNKEPKMADCECDYDGTHAAWCYEDRVRRAAAEGAGTPQPKKGASDDERA